MKRSPIDRGREFLKDTVRLEFDFSRTDQSRGVAPPPLSKPCPPDAVRVSLPREDEGPAGGAPGRGVFSVDLSRAIAERRSRRRYRGESLSIDEISFLLWATQGVRTVLNDGTALRTVPSAGCRHALETYVIALDIEGLERGIHRYLPVEHELCTLLTGEDLPPRIVPAVLGQRFVAEAAAVLVWTAIPYRMEWRYGDVAHKVIALDAGHVCQNLYLACSAVGAGTCAVAAYHQVLMDQLIGVDGEEEFTIYLAPVGKV